MATMKIKKGDMVKVIAGKDKDKEGKVIAVNTKNNTVLVLFFKSTQLFCLLSSINRSLRLFSLRNVLFYLHPSRNLRG